MTTSVEIYRELLKLKSEFLGELLKIYDQDDPKNFCVLPKRMIEGYLDKIRSMKVYEDDVWIITNPKCGTTLTMEMVWLIVNDMNFKKAAETDLEERIPFIEFEGFTSGTSSECYPFQQSQNMPRPRIIKTHLPPFLLPKELFIVKPKLIYVTRNPKDAVISFYHHHINFNQWKEADLHTFIEAFVKDLNFYSPFNDHVLKFWEMRHELNLLFLHYEDMIKDLKSITQKVAKYLGKAYAPENFDKLATHLSFENMKNNNMVNKAGVLAAIRESQGLDHNGEWSFMRKGKVGSHKEELNETQIERLDEYVKALEAKTDFRFKFE